MKKEKGITLIALIVTIVVLLIIASISIAILTGDSGIISQAKKAKEETVIADEKEGISIGYVNCQKKKSNDNVTASDLEEKMRNDGRDVTVTENGNDLNVRYTETGHEYIVNQDGDIEEKDSDPIINAVIIGRGIIIEKASGKVYWVDEEFDIYSRELKKLDVSNKELITKDGIKEKYDHFGFIDKKGKAYLLNENSELVCVNDLKGSELKKQRVLSVDTDNGLFYSVIDEEGRLYYYISGKSKDGIDMVEPYCISNKEWINNTTNELYEKRIIEVNGDLALDENGNVYQYVKCLSNEEGSVLKNKKITKIAVNRYIEEPYKICILIDDQGKIYTRGSNIGGLLGNGSTDDKDVFICISDLNDSILKGKKIIDINNVCASVFAIDENYKLYAWGYNYLGQFGDETSEYNTKPICLSETQGSLLYGKSIKKIIPHYDRDTAFLDNDENLYKIEYNSESKKYEYVSLSDKYEVLNGKKLKDILPGDLILDNEQRIYKLNYDYNKNVGDVIDTGLDGINYNTSGYNDIFSSIFVTPNSEVYYIILNYQS